MKTAQNILDFWFSEQTKPFWFAKNDEFDRDCKQFEITLRAAAAGECEGWRSSIEGRLAEIILLDQFSRNLFRDTPAAFSQDAMALVLAQEAVKSPGYTALEPSRRKFILMPYMHSESAWIHQQSLPLFAALGDELTLDFELRHKAIIDRFGRYPHRNLILNRASSAEELAFLQQADSSF